MRQKLFCFLGILLLICGLTGCATMDLSLDYDRTTDFSRYKTYAWLSETGTRPDLSIAQNDLIDARVKRYANQALTAKGYRLVPEKDADFLVTYHNVFEEKMDVRTIGGYGYNYGWGPGFYWHTHCRRGFRNYTWVAPYTVEPRTYVYYYTEGTLILDIIDRRNQKLVWRGTSVRVVNETTPEALDQKIQEAVSRLLEQFPPPSPLRKEIRVDETVSQKS